MTMRDSKTLLLAFAAPFCFGTGFTLAKPAVTHFPPLLMMLFAYGFIALISVFSVRTPLKTLWWKSCLIASCAVTVQGALLFWGLRSTDSTTANLLLQMQVPAAVLLGWLMLHESLSLHKILGTLIAVLGVAIIIGLPAERPPLAPVLLIVSSGFVWALGQVLIRKWGKDHGEGTLKANALWGVPQLAIASLLIEQGQWQAITSAGLKEWATLAFVCVVGFYIAYRAWFATLKRMPMDEAAPWILLMTPIGLLTAVLFLGESMSLVQIVGAVILMGGLAIVNGIGVLPPSQKRENQVIKPK
jgi:O-acetylserine/cysteine efflux transporter